MGEEAVYIWSKVSSFWFKGLVVMFSFATVLKYL